MRFFILSLKTHITLLLPVYVHSWEQRKLGDLVIDHNAGIYISKEDYGEGTNVIGVGNIYDRDIFNGEIYRLGPVNDDKFILEENDIIYGESSLVPEGIARTVCVGKNGAGSAFAWHTRRVKLDKNIVNSHVATLELNYLHDIRKYLVSVSTQTALTGMTTEGYFGATLTLPSVEEQQKISSYFKKLDLLITLHQRKCQIDGCRFQSPLAITWEQRKFDEVFDCTVPNNTLSRAELSYDEGTVLNVHYGDVLIKYGSVLDVQKDDIPRIPHRCREDFNGALLQDGDVIIADTAEDETTGKACEIGNLQGSAIVSGLHTMVCRPRNRMALGYLGYYLNSNAYHHQLLPLMQGIKVLSLSRSNIQKTSVSYPIAVKEQQLIAYYFSQLDHLITLHQCE